MCDVDGWDRAEMWSNVVVKSARKEHDCSSCHATIMPGSSYVRHFSVSSDSGVCSEKVCLACVSASEEFMEEHKMAPVPSYLHDALVECVLEEPETAPRWQPIIDAMRERMAIK